MSDDDAPSRPVVDVPGSQLSLGGWQTGMAAPGDECREDALREEQTRSFRDPAPGDVTIGGLSLEAYLRKSGLGWVFHLRDITRSVNYKPFIERYDARGRAPYHPAAMMGLITYGLVEGAESLRALEELARRDVGCWWASGGICPDHATIGRFIERHADQIGGTFFEKTTAEILETAGHPSREVAGDGTVMEAVASRYQAVKTEAARQLAAEQAETDDDSGKLDSGETGGTDGPRTDVEADDSASHPTTSVETLEEAIEERMESRDSRNENIENIRFSPTEPQAVWHKLKSGGYRFGYVPSIIVNTDRFIVAHQLHRTQETPVVGRMLDQTERVFGHLGDSEEARSSEVSPIERLMLDSNYHTLDILEMTYERGLDTLIPAPGHLDEDANKVAGVPMSRGKFSKWGFEYDPLQQALVCPADRPMRLQSSSYDEDVGRPYDVHRANECQDCALQEMCTSSDRGRSVKRFEGDIYKDIMRQVMRHPRARTAYESRMGSVEPVFAALKRHGMDRSQRRGVSGASTDVALHSVAHNFRRLKTKVLQGEIGVPKRPFFGAVSPQYPSTRAILSPCATQRLQFMWHSHCSTAYSRPTHLPSYRQIGGPTLAC